MQDLEDDIQSIDDNEYWDKREREEREDPEGTFWTRQQLETHQTEMEQAYRVGEARDRQARREERERGKYPGTMEELKRMRKVLKDTLITGRRQRLQERRPAPKAAPAGIRQPYHHKAIQDMTPPELRDKVRAEVGHCPPQHLLPSTGFHSGYRHWNLHGDFRKMSTTTSLPRIPCDLIIRCIQWILTIRVWYLSLPVFDLGRQKHIVMAVAPLDTEACRIEDAHNLVVIATKVVIAFWILEPTWFQGILLSVRSAACAAGKVTDVSCIQQCWGQQCLSLGSRPCRTC
eukprot:4887765-Amphidinium_carterae.2